MSAMEIELIEGTVYKSKQILSFCNKVTSEYHTVVSNILLNYVNMNYLEDIYENKMKSYESIDMLNRGFLINLDDEKTDKNRTGSFEIFDDYLFGQAENVPLTAQTHLNLINVTQPNVWNDPNVFGLE